MKWQDPLFYNSIDRKHHIFEFQQCITVCLKTHFHLYTISQSFYIATVGLFSFEPSNNILFLFLYMCVYIWTSIIHAEESLYSKAWTKLRLQCGISFEIWSIFSFAQECLARTLQTVEQQCTKRASCSLTANKLQGWNPLEIRFSNNWHFKNFWKWVFALSNTKKVHILDRSTVQLRAGQGR